MAGCAPASLTLPQLKLQPVDQLKKLQGAPEKEKSDGKSDKNQASQLTNSLKQQR